MAALVSVMNGWLVVAVHAHDAVVDTRMLLLPPANPTSIVVCGMVSVQLPLGDVGELACEHDQAAHSDTNTANRRTV
jgi:hypothetical protein